MLTFQADSAIFRRGEMSVSVLFRENHRYGSKPWGTDYNKEEINRGDSVTYWTVKSSNKKITLSCKFMVSLSC